MDILIGAELDTFVPINVVQAEVGHKRLTTTQIYSKVAPKLVKEAYDTAGFE